MPSARSALGLDLIIPTSWYRLRGAVLAEAGNAAEAASWFQQAIDTARSQQARSLELRAATSLAGLWVDQGSYSHKTCRRRSRSLSSGRAGPS